MGTRGLAWERPECRPGGQQRCWGSLPPPPLPEHRWGGTWPRRGHRWEVGTQVALPWTQVGSGNPGGPVLDTGGGMGPRSPALAGSQTALPWTQARCGGIAHGQHCLGSQNTDVLAGNHTQPYHEPSKQTCPCPHPGRAGIESSSFQHPAAPGLTRAPLLPAPLRGASALVFNLTAPSSKCPPNTLRPLTMGDEVPVAVWTLHLLAISLSSGPRTVKVTGLL